MTTLDYEDDETARARQLREWRRAAEARKAAGLTLRRERSAPREDAGLQVQDAAVQTATVAVSADRPREPIDAEAAFRHARLGVSLALVLALVWLWIRERRAARRK